MSVEWMTVQSGDYASSDLNGRPRAIPVLPRPAHRVYALYGKRVLDCLLILLALPIALPLIAMLALLASLDGGTPFYRQKRIGRHGKIFYMLKIRTMVPDAEGALETHLSADPAARREWDEKQKLIQDPRITWIGTALRKTSLDELPQLWNVFKGEMSLVGPRPMMVDQKEIYPGAAYFELRPGITGPWQVSDRNASSFADRAEFDLDYYRRVSLKTDITLLFQTVGAVLRGTGC